MVILWLLDLNPMDNATTLLLSNLRERCLSRSATLYTSKPRYYANSEHHRLKLRLIQALAAIVSVDAVWDERFADALLNESNQPNITFILECILAYTIEPDRLINLLEQVWERWNILKSLNLKKIVENLKISKQKDISLLRFSHLKKFSSRFLFLRHIIINIILNFPFSVKITECPSIIIYDNVLRV